MTNYPHVRTDDIMVNLRDNDLIGEIDCRSVWIADDITPLHFFFQAEDGIRDYKVTGVQTCALPISGLVDGPNLSLNGPAGEVQPAFLCSHRSLAPQRRKGGSSDHGATLNRAGGSCRAVKIGRASCRGKSVDLGGRRIIKKKNNRECG